MIFLDTSFLIAYYNSQDVNHEKAVKIMKDSLDNTYGNLFTNDFIFGECATMLSRKLSNQEDVIKVVRDISEFVELNNLGKDEFNKVLDLFIKQKSKKFSFFDLSILVSMQKEKAGYLATFDKEFEKIKGLSVISQ